MIMIGQEPHGDVPTGRSSLVAQVHGNSLFIFGGYNGQVRGSSFRAAMVVAAWWL